MNAFIFSKKTHLLIFEKFSINFLGIEKPVIIKSDWMLGKTEFNITFDNKKGSLRISKRGHLQTLYKGDFNTTKLEIKQTNKEISRSHNRCYKRYRI